MNIAFFTDTYFPHLNGVTISIEQYTRELRKKGHTVYIVAPRIKGYKDKNPYVLRLPSVKILSSEPEAYIPIPSPRSILKIFRLNFDLIHAHGNWAFSFLGHQVARAKGIPFILSFHTLHTEYTHYVLKGKLIKPHMVAAGLRIFAHHCDAVITPSEKMRDALGSFGVKRKILVLPNFIDSSAFLVKKSNFLQEKYNLPDNTPIIITVGRLGKEKNFSFIIDAFAKLSQKNKSVHLVIVGKGPEKKTLQQLAKKYRLGNRIHFTGKVLREYMPLVYSSAQIFTFASTTETQAIVVLEAEAAGLPLILVNDPAFKNMLIDNINGFSLPLDTGMFAEKMQLLLTNEILRKQMGQESRKLLTHNFPPQILTAKLIDLYDYVLVNNHNKKNKRSFKFNVKTAYAQFIKARQSFEKFRTFVKKWY